MIDNRLKSLVKYFTKKDNVIDIGCDHALLDIYLIKNNKINSIIISDISKNALNQGIKNVKKYNLLDKIDTRCGNGLTVLTENDTVNTILISGMGTNTILNIFDNNYLNKVNKLIIQSNNDYYELRKEIVKRGFKIHNEEVIIVNNKTYINIVFIKGNKKYTKNELKYGTKNMINKEIYYKCILEKLNSIILKITNDDVKKDLEKEVNNIEKLLKDC